MRVHQRPKSLMAVKMSLERLTGNIRPTESALEELWPFPERGRSVDDRLEWLLESHGIEEAGLERAGETTTLVILTIADGSAADVQRLIGTLADTVECPIRIASREEWSARTGVSK